MKTFDFKATLGLNRCVSCSDMSLLPDDQRMVCEQIKDFGIDEIYFSTDENKSYPAVFLKKVSQFDTETLKEIARIHKYIWNYQKVLFLYVYSDTEIRIYNCTAKPFAENRNTDYAKELKKLEIQVASSQDKEALAHLVSLFSSIAIDTGIVWTLPEAIEIRKKINLQKRVDRYLVDSLTHATKDLQQLGLTDITIIHKIILRSLFLLYLEDRGATGKDFYKTIKPNAETYFDILEDVDATYRLFAKLEEQFNGNVFSVVEGEQQNIEQKHLEIIRKCFVSGYEGDGQAELFSEWRLFDFNIIQIELISEIYERFLAETDEKKKKNAGAFYTPPSLVTLILDEVLPIGKKYTNYNVKILDPACGSGIFLVESYKRLLKRYENAHNEKLTNFEQLNKILTDNIYGIEQNDQAIIVAAFSLYLALVDNLDPKTLWISTKLPCLINDPDHVPEKKKGNNLFCRDTIAQNDEIESIQFDLVVGNPPFGTEDRSKGVILTDSIRSYCAKYGFAKEMVLPFLHKAVQFAPQGKIALIFNAKVLTNTNSSYRKFRQWLFGDCYVEKIYNFSILRNATKNFGGQLFGSARGPICIAFYQKEKPTISSDRITYYAPKTYIKSNILDGVVIDSSDVKYLPREICQKPDSKIWKIAMWGSNNDYALIEKLSKYRTTIKSFIKNNQCAYGVGLQPYNTSTVRPIINNEIAGIPYIKPDNIVRYFSPKNQKCNLKYALKDTKTIALNLKHYRVQSIDEIACLNVFRREGATDVYGGPMLLIKEGLTNKRICASILKEATTFNSTVLGIKSNIQNLRLLSALINSRLATYFLLMTSSSWGMERERIKPNEVYSFPIMMNEPSAEQIDKIHASIENTNVFEENKVQQFEQKLDKIIESQYQLSKQELALINDFVDITTSLLYDKEKSKALKPVSDFDEYAEMLCSQMNEFIETPDLYANGTKYTISPHSALAVIKISLDTHKHDVIESDENINDLISMLSEKIWKAKGQNIFFRKKLLFFNENDIYIIRPNQKRFWTKSMALDDASEIIMEILNMED